MTFAYFDTSALVKRYVSEQGSARVSSLLRRYDLLSSAITPVELLSALSTRKLNGDLSEAGFSAILSRVQSDRPRWELVEVGAAVLDRAEEIVRPAMPMRALDAIHVASLMAVHAAASIEIPFITGDRRQRDAAVHLGLDVVWVG